MARTILIGYDHSEASRNAINWVIQNSILSPSDKVIITTVVNDDRITIEGTFGLEATTIEPSSHGDEHESISKPELHAKTALEQVIRLFQKLGVEPIPKILTGEAGEAMMHEAEQQRADMVIVGSRGLGFLKRQILGSVSEYLLYHLKCSVLVVKPDNVAKPHN